MAFFLSLQKKYNCKFTHDYAEISQFINKQVHYQDLSGCNSITILGIGLKHF